MIDREQAETYKILVDIGLKLAFGVVSLLMFIAFGVVLICHPDSYPVAMADGFITLTIGYCFKHYFPAGSSSST